MDEKNVKKRVVKKIAVKLPSNQPPMVMEDKPVKKVVKGVKKEPEVVYDAKKEVMVEGSEEKPKKVRKPRVKKERTEAEKEADKAKMAKLREMRKKK